MVFLGYVVCVLLPSTHGFDLVCGNCEVLVDIQILVMCFLSPFLLLFLLERFASSQ